MNQLTGEYKAIIIAADKYIHLTNLPNTVNDATEIKVLLTEEPSLFKKENVQYIHENLATKQILTASLTSFFNHANSEDILFLFWAGHGGEKDGEGYFASFDTNQHKSTMIQMQDIRNLIEDTDAKTVIALFDTCHSGAIARSTDSMLARGIEVKGEGKVLIAACLPNQSAWDRRGHGAFTDYLIQGLQGEAADKNGEIDVYNLYSYLSHQLKNEFADGSQLPLMKSTISGTPITLKRITSRTESKYLTTNKSMFLNSSGDYFLLGQLIAKYEEYRDTDSAKHILVKNLNSREDRKIRDMRNTKQLFAIHDEAGIFNVQSIDVVNKQGETYYTLVLQLQLGSGNWIHDDMSFQENGRKYTATDVAKARIDRFLGIESTSTTTGFGGSMIENAIMNPINSPVKVKTGLVQSLVKEGLEFEQVRLVLVAHLLLTRTLSEIVELAFTIESGEITEMKLIGYRPKIYNNVAAERVELVKKVKKFE